MATENRQERTDIAPSSNTSEPGSLNEFFEMVRRVERRAAERNKNNDSIDKYLESFIGTDSLPHKEAIRFKGNYSLAFAGSAIESMQLLLDEHTSIHEISEKNGVEKLKRNEIYINFMGIAGPSGVLPQHYSRLMLDRIKHKDHALVDFIDLFNHRLASLFYRSWIKYRFAQQREYFELQNKVDPFTNVVGSLAGKSTKKDLDAQLYYSGHFSKKNKSVTNLENMLADYLNVPVKVSSFVGNWLSIEKKDRSMLSSKISKTSQKLGEGIMLGKRSWDVSSKIAIYIGSIDLETYRKFLPGTNLHSSFKKLIESYVPIHIKIDLFFKVHDVKSEGARLGSGIKLKQDFWLQRSDTSGGLVSKLSFARSL
ncbi:MAG: type VI secretion system baseplate subunit TssG [Cellvibrionaceae bacterium]